MNVVCILHPNGLIWQKIPLHQWDLLKKLHRDDQTNRHHHLFLFVFGIIALCFALTH